jgi:hypothetical protein
VTEITQTRMNVVLALAIPAAGLAYLTIGIALSPSRFAIAAIVALGVVWLTATAAVNTVQRPRRVVAARTREVAKGKLSRHVTTPAFPAYLDVTRPVTPWRWTSVLLAPVELVALAWSVPVLMLLVMVPIGLTLAGALWVGRLILRS